MARLSSFEKKKRRALSVLPGQLTGAAKRKALSGLVGNEVIASSHTPTRSAIVTKDAGASHLNKAVFSDGKNRQGRVSMATAGGQPKPVGNVDPRGLGGVSASFSPIQRVSRAVGALSPRQQAEQEHMAGLTTAQRLAVSSGQGSVYSKQQREKKIASSAAGIQSGVDAQKAADTLASQRAHDIAVKEAGPKVRLEGKLADIKGKAARLGVKLQHDGVENAAQLQGNLDVVSAKLAGAKELQGDKAEDASALVKEQFKNLIKTKKMDLNSALSILDKEAENAKAGDNEAYARVVVDAKIDLISDGLAAAIKINDVATIQTLTEQLRGFSQESPIEGKSQTGVAGDADGNGVVDGKEFQAAQDQIAQIERSIVDKQYISPNTGEPVSVEGKVLENMQNRLKALRLVKQTGTVNAKQ